MKLNIQYCTKERIYLSDHTYSPVYANTELEALEIYRYPCGTGAAANRYTYRARFAAPNDAESTYDGQIVENIVRKLNKHFKPKDFEWVGQRAIMINDGLV